MPQRDFMQVKQAATLLQVAPNTIRAWGASGKIPEYRHPLNGYRLYRRSDLEEIIRRLERSIVRASKAKLRKRAR